MLAVPPASSSSRSSPTACQTALLSLLLPSAPTLQTLATPNIQTPPPRTHRVQFMGRPFAEATLLRVAAALEQCMLEEAQPKPVPGLIINPIACEKGAHPKARAMTQKLWATKYGSSGGAK